MGVLVIVFIVIFAIWHGADLEPKDTVAGRWATKGKKIASGKFGGKKWGDDS